MIHRYCCPRLGTKSFELLEYNEKSGFYEDAKRNGYSLKDVQTHSHLFITDDSSEELKNKFDFHIYTLKYGEGKVGGVACPKCGFKHDFDYYDGEYGGIVEGSEEHRVCFCGAQLKLYIKVQVEMIADVLN